MVHFFDTIRKMEYFIIISPGPQSVVGFAHDACENTVCCQIVKLLLLFGNLHCTLVMHSPMFGLCQCKGNCTKHRRTTNQIVTFIRNRILMFLILFLEYEIARPQRFKLNVFKLRRRIMTRNEQNEMSNIQIFCFTPLPIFALN